MIEEIHFGGIYVPAALATAVLSGVLVYLVRAPMQRMTFYRLLWQPALFDLAVFILLWWGLMAYSLAHSSRFCLMNGGPLSLPTGRP